jgi:hypothetical protein
LTVSAAAMPLLAEIPAILRTNGNPAAQPVAAG